MNDELDALRASVATVAERAVASGAVRAVVDSGSYRDTDLATVAELGWSAIAIPEKLGGADASYTELTTVLEELGRSLLPTTLLTEAGLAASVLLPLAADSAAAEVLGAIADGTSRVTLAYVGPTERRRPTVTVDGDVARMSGELVAVPDVAGADTVVVVIETPAVDGAASGALAVHLVDLGAEGVDIEPAAAFDLLRPSANLRLRDVRVTLVPDDGGAGANRGLALASLALAAEQVGGASRALTDAVEYAKLREQFGRPIGANQAIQHLCADTYASVEAARALLGVSTELVDGDPVAFELMASLAAAACSDAYVEAAANSLHVHGGIGFTWEHDAHLHVRRAHADSSLLGDATGHRERAARLLLAGAGAALDADGPAVTGNEELESFRRTVREWLAAEAPPFADTADRSISIFARRDDADERDYVARAQRWQAHKFAAGWAGLAIPVDAGGRGRPVVEAVLFDEQEQKHGLPLDAYSVSLGMIAPTLARWGTPAQHEKYLRPLLAGEAIWCQLFSEPGAGSDLAGLKVRARPDGDGWLVSGQKVWTSYAQFAEFGYLLARTGDGPTKHAGISAFVVDMRHPAVTVRPLKQATGSETFNEVFFDDLPVAREDLLGPEGEGWTVAISTLMSERYALNPSAVPAAELLDLFRSLPGADDAFDRQDLARVHSAHQVLVALKDRLLGQAASGTEPGPEGSITKLLATDAQIVAARVATRLLGSEARLDGPWTEFLMGVQGLRIGGGSDEILKTVVAERVLGLPRR